MEFLLILYSIFASSILIWCTLQEPTQVAPKPPVRYLVISSLLFNNWRRTRPDLVVIDLRDQARDSIAGALNVTPNQLEGLLRWIPPKTTLAFCGIREAELCRHEIGPTLLQAGINLVYVVEGRAASTTVPTSQQRTQV